MLFYTKIVKIEAFDVMFVTREMDYYIRIVRALYHGGLQSANEIATKENMPPAITYKLLKAMLKADIVKSFRGTDGGYQLTVDCSNFTLMDLYRRLGIEIIVNKCMMPGYQCENISCDKCKVHQELSRIQAVITRELSSKPLCEIL